MAKEHIKCLTSYSIRELQSVRYHYTPVTMGKLPTKDHTDRW